MLIFEGFDYPKGILSYLSIVVIGKDLRVDLAIMILILIHTVVSYPRNIVEHALRLNMEPIK